MVREVTVRYYSLILAIRKEDDHVGELTLSRLINQGVCSDGTL